MKKEKCLTKEELEEFYEQKELEKRSVRKENAINVLTTLTVLLSVAVVFVCFVALSMVIAETFSNRTYNFDSVLLVLIIIGVPLSILNFIAFGLRNS